MDRLDHARCNDNRVAAEMSRQASKLMLEQRQGLGYLDQHPIELAG